MPHRSPIVPRALAGLAALVLPLLALSPASATSAGAGTHGACTEQQGVTVVVDFTDLGGEIVVACAEGAPASGRAALELAGFTATDSIPGMVCAIDAQPDPCPETFDGSYWAYFGAGPNEPWVPRAEGADTAVPAPGTFEGWRYNDGATGPGVSTAELAAGTPGADAAPGAISTPAETAAEQPGSEPEGGEPEGGEPEGGEPATVVDDRHSAQSGTGEPAGPSGATIGGIGAVAALLVGAGVLVRRRRQG